MDSAVRKFLSENGKIGGSSKSEKKLKALELNRQKWSNMTPKERKRKHETNK